MRDNGDKMIPRRKNFSTKSYKARVSGSPEEMYTQWHWGIKPNPKPLKIDDPDYPEILIECGRLVEFTYRPPNHNPKLKDKIFKLDKVDSNNTHLAFDPEHPHDRLYIISTTKKAKNNISKELYKPNPHVDVPIADISRFAGGKHAASDYPNVEARALGVMTTVVYACEKKPDGYSFYVHKLGEESGVQPIVAVGNDGRLWIVGGNYTAPLQGITD